MAARIPRTATASVQCCDALTLAKGMKNVDAWITDPPYYGVVAEGWDNQWKSSEQFVNWWLEIADAMFEATSPTGSLVFFCGVGPASQHAADLLIGMRKSRWTFRNWLTWSKRRGFGKQVDYVNAREEILWYSKSKERTEVTFNKPFQNQKSEFTKTFGGGENPNEYKRATTVWNDVPEPLSAKPSGHPCEKPDGVIRRLIETHSNRGQLVVDPFCGSGAIGLLAHSLGRNVVMADASPKWASYVKEKL